MLRPTISEAEVEKIIDRRVMRALDRSASYRNAENAEEQAAVEERLTQEIELDVYSKYEVS